MPKPRSIVRPTPWSDSRARLGGAAEPSRAYAKETVSAVFIAIVLLNAHGTFGTNRSVQFTIAAASICLALLSRRRPLSTLKSLPALTVFIAYLCASILWSSAVLPSLVAVLTMVSELCVGLWIGSAGPSMVRTVVLSLQLLLLGSLGTALFNAGAWTIDERAYLVGLFSTKNELGLFIATALPYLLVYTKKLARLVWLTISLYLLALSGSQASLVSSAFILSTALGAQWLYRARRRARASAAILIAYVGVAIWIMANFFQQILELLGKDPTLNRRTDIWEAVVEYGSATPWFGTGLGGQIYAGSELLANIQAVSSPTVHSTHNGYLTVFLAGGSVGVALLVVTISSFSVRLLCAEPTVLDARLRLLAIGTTVGYIISSLAEDVTLWRGGLMFLTIVIARVALETSARPTTEAPARPRRRDVLARSSLARSESV